MSTTEIATPRVELDIDDHVATITINAPAQRNALSPTMARQLAEFCDEIDANPNIGAAIIRGAGGNFCSGAHRDVLRTAGADPADPDSYEDNTAVYGSFMRVGHLAVPTVAAVQGAAVGAGMNLLLATDLRIVADDARLTPGFLKIGIHPGGGHFTLLNRVAGREATAALALFSQEISGARAVELGIAWSATEPGQVDAEAKRLATEAAKDPELIRAAVVSFREECNPPGLSWETALRSERATQMWSLRRRAINGSERKRAFGD